MNLLFAIILGVVEGITEFLPISSTGHLMIVEKLMGFQIDEPGIAAFTAIIQIGSIAAAVIYFRKDIVRVALAWLAGLSDKKRRNMDYKLGWYVIVGSVPIVVVGLLFKHQIETSFRSLWVVAAGLIVWSVVLWLADKKGSEKREEEDITMKDALIIGAAQSLAVVPGVSRSGATIAAGLFRGLDRVTATRLSFFLGIPALVAAGGFEAVTQASHVTTGVGWPATIVATLVSFGVGYVAIAWLIKFVSAHNFSSFIVYRIALGVGIILLVVSGAVTAV
jgi:undecaprenyl-diphosphatase